MQHPQIRGDIFGAEKRSHLLLYSPQHLVYLSGHGPTCSCQRDGDFSARGRMRLASQPAAPLKPVEDASQR